ncbi:hypothetical protein NEAUS07_1611 [Nematocida ausubeli]|nr:hypothetical protein NEAUS07_1611 [Nematocida ausubeli]
MCINQDILLGSLQAYLSLSLDLAKSLFKGQEYSEEETNWLKINLNGIIHRGKFRTILQMVNGKGGGEEWVRKMVSQGVTESIAVFRIFNSLMLAYPERNEFYSEVLQECMAAREKYFYANTNALISLIQAVECTSSDCKLKNHFISGYSKDARYYGLYTLEEIYERIGYEGIFWFVSKNHKAMSQRLLRSLIFHWNTLLENDIFIENNLPCSHLFDHSYSYRMSVRDHRISANEVIYEYSNLRDNFIMYLENTQEPPVYKEMFYETQYEAERKVKRVPKIMIKRKIKELLRGKRKNYTMLAVIIVILIVFLLDIAYTELYKAIPIAIYRILQLALYITLRLSTVAQRLEKEVSTTGVYMLI